MAASWMWLLMMGQAIAGDLAPFDGNWAVDLSDSDKAAERLMAMGRQASGQDQAGPNPGARFSPDSGQGDQADQVNRGWSNLQYLVQASGEVLLSEQSDKVLGFRLPGDELVSVNVGGGWTKVKGDHNYKVRASVYEQHLMIQRKGNGNLVSETWLPPKSEDERVVVVSVRSSLLGKEVEFRRVYRRLRKAQGKAPSSMTPAGVDDNP